MKGKLPTDTSIKLTKELSRLRPFSVTWQDAFSTGGWDSLDSYRSKTPSVCSSVGYLIKNTATEIQLVQSISEKGNVTDSIIIPKGWVKRMKRLA